MFRQAGVVAAVAACAFGTLAGSAGAHEGEHGGAPEAFPVTCQDVEYLITTGNGNWSAAVTSDKKTRFIPTAFSGSFEVKDADGNVIDSGSFADHKGNGNAHQNQEKITCTFGDSGTDPETGVSWTFNGTAIVVKR